MNTTSGSVLLDGGSACIDLASRQLLLNGEPARLGSRAFDLLAVLLAHRERVVSKQELMDRVWPGLVVEENNLQVHVMTLRRLLGAAAISTVSGCGYRFTLPVVAPPQAREPEALPGLPPHDGLLGRQAETGAALAQLGNRQNRLLTLLGPGGSGKTRLASHVAALLAGQRADGAYTVLLAPVRDGEHMMVAIAAALGVRECGSIPIAELVHTFLAERELLLLLDNLEHLREASGTVAGLLGAAPRLQVLATSRVALQLAGEVRLEVPPLALPTTDDEAAWRESPAVQLFVQRAAALGQRIEGAGTLRAAAEVCRRLDGLPLAIELAAARLRVLSPAALATRLQQRLPLLQDRGAGRPQRHQTLRGTIAWSQELLEASAQRLFRRLAVFAGGWSMDAAEQIDPQPGCIDRLEQLIEHHLVQRLEDIAGEPRFTILETVREFALEELTAAGELEEARERHADAMLGLASSLGPLITSAGRGVPLLRLRTEMNNLRGALAWLAHGRRDASRALRLAAALAWPWYFEGHFVEGQAWLGAALALPGGSVAERAAALTGAARVAAYGAKVQQGLALANEAVALWRGLDAPRELAFALLLVAIASSMADDHAAARAPLLEARALFAAAADHWGEALATGYLGATFAIPLGHEAEGAALMLESRARFIALGDGWGSSMSAHYLSSIALRQGDLAAARRYGEETLANSRETGDSFRLARNLHQLAEIDFAAGERAAGLARVAESLAITVEASRLGDAALQLRLLCGVAVQMGEPALAVQLAAMAAPHARASRTFPSDDPAQHAALLGRLQQQLGELRWREAWAGGSTLPLDRAVVIAQSLSRQAAAA